MSSSDSSSSDPKSTVSTKGVGASLPRKEDYRHLHGLGRFVADLEATGALDVAFVRSPLGHAGLKSIQIAAPDQGKVFTAGDLEGVKPIEARSALPGFKISSQPPLATDRVRYVGEAIAACVADTRAEAEDIAERVQLELEEWPAVSDMLAARDVDSALLHPEWGDNVFLESNVDIEIESARAAAELTVRRTIRTARQSMAPIEGRAVLAQWDPRLDMLVMHSATQLPHIIRNGLAECLNLEQAQIRVIAPDVGGGFGYKGLLLPEEVILGWLAMQLKRPVRWIEDRREQLVGNANCREHHYDITAYARRDGKLLGIECEAHVDTGAYSIYPFSACLEAAQIASILPGTYVFDGYRCRTFSMATNKPALVPYRGVARTGVCFALEVLLDSVAREIGMDPVEFRLKNIVRPEQMPFDNITNKHFDSGDYVTCMRRAADALGLEQVRARQQQGEADGRRIGVGFSTYCEQAAHGTSVYAGWGVPMIPGWEQATVRLTADGGLEIRVGVQSHGQSLETTLAQIANELLSIDPDQIKVVHGDTGMTPYSTGTWGSRCIVMAGGAVASACEELRERVCKLAAHLLQADNEQLQFDRGHVRSSGGEVSLADIGKLWYHAPQDLPSDVDPHGLEVTQGYKMVRDSGTFSYATHACVVAVDAESGDVELLDYVIVEDGGVLINPMVVDGQILGGAAQGIGTALYEEMPFDDRAQPLASTLADYHLPGASEIPSIRIEHMETPSPYTRFGQKGIGEGGAIAPPAAIANAINDALSPLGVEMTESPISRERLLEALIDAERAAVQSGQGS